MMAYVPALSGLRAFACIAVMLFHCKVAWGLGGFHGVDVFFVLSGFLTASILAKHGGSFAATDVIGFVERRAWRIMPLMVVVCLSVGAVLWAFVPDADVVTEVFAPILNVSNIATAMKAGPDYMLHSWSVSGEMQFYAFSAVVFACLARLGKPALCATFLGLFVAVTVMRFGAFYQGWTWPSIYFSPVLRLSGLFLGAGLALMSIRSRPWMAWFAWPAMAVIGSAVFFANYRSALSFTIFGTAVELATAVLIVVLMGSTKTQLGAVLSNKVIERLGLWSYGIYLWHYPIARAVRDNMAPEIAFAVTFGASVALAGVTYHYVEQRFRYRKALRFGGAFSGAVSSSDEGSHRALAGPTDRVARGI